MNTQLTVTNLMVMWSGSTILSVLLFMRAYDLWREGDRNGASIRAGIGTFLAAVSFEYFWWLLRWLLLDEGLSVISQWFVDNASVTLMAGVIASLGVALSVGGVLWGQMRWRGLSIAAAGILATWVIGLMV